MFSLKDFVGSECRDFMNKSVARREKKQNKSDLTDIPGSSDLKQYNMLYVKILHAKHDFF